MKTLIRTGKTILLDDEDLERVLAFECEWARKWSVDKTDHVGASLLNYRVQLGRFVLNYNGDGVVDHKNRNPLDNQKLNLRAVTNSIDKHNSKAGADKSNGCRGVRWDQFNKRWLAGITVNRVKKYLGSFTKLEDAVEARKAAEQLYYNDICLPTKT